MTGLDRLVPLSRNEISYASWETTTSKNGQSNHDYYPNWDWEAQSPTAGSGPGDSGSMTTSSLATVVQIEIRTRKIHGVKGAKSRSGKQLPHHFHHFGSYEDTMFRKIPSLVPYPPALLLAGTGVFNFRPKFPACSRFRDSRLANPLDQRLSQDDVRPGVWLFLSRYGRARLYELLLLFVSLLITFEGREAPSQYLLRCIIFGVLWMEYI